jgi:homoserine dehydrogenase
MRVAVLGAGTVGREVVRALLERSHDLAPNDGAALELAGVAVRDLARARAAGIPADLLSDAPAHLVADPGVDVVVELMGGDEPARTLIAAALGAGKPVVSANKHVIAHHGAELEAIARRTGAALRFEAAVAGGIPVLGPLATDLAANRVRSVTGIVNGTTNYILTAMTHEGRDYADVLEAAQAAGYAEADPTGDVEGDDAANKLVILARLAFGVWIAPADVRRVADGAPGHGRRGITGVTGADVAAAAASGQVIKLIARAEALNGVVAASVLPTTLPAASPLGSTDGVLNRIEIEADPVGTVAFSGPGAGGAATSSAVLGDLVGIARGLGSTWAGLPPAGTAVLASPGRSAAEAMAR